MPRVRGQKNITTLIKEGTLPPEARNWPKKRRDEYLNKKHVDKKVDKRTDEEILANTRAGFEIYAKVVRAAAHGMVNAAIASGSPGIAKTHIACSVLESEVNKNGIRFFHVKGTASAFDLYELAYRYRNPTDVLLLDDADRILHDEEGMNIMKALLDTSDNRIVSWLTDHPRFKGEDGLPKQFTYQGSIIYITNRDFQTEVQTTNSKFTDHMEALLDRTLYIDLAIHDRRSIMLWIEHLVTMNKILQGIGVSAEDEKHALSWLKKHRDQLTELTLRTALKVGRMILMSNSENASIRVDWEDMATRTLLKRA